MRVSIHSRFIEAVQACMSAKDAGHLFNIVSAVRPNQRAHAQHDLSEADLDTLTLDDRALVASTFFDWGMDLDTITASFVEGDRHYGTVLSHYTTKGDIVRFVAVYHPHEL